MNRRLLPTLIGIVIVVLLAGLRLADPYPLPTARDAAFDLYQRLQPRTGPEGPVRVVDIDETSLQRYGQWPWPRDRLALLVDRLAALGAVAIGFDVLFPEADRMSPRLLAAGVPGLDPAQLPDTDAIFARSLAAAPTVLGFSRAPSAPPLLGPAKSGFAISGGDPTPSLPVLTGAVTPIAPLRDAARGLGSLSLNTSDSASVVRRVPLLWSNGTEMFPAFSLEALRLAFGVDTIVALGDTDNAGTMEAIRVGGLSIPTNAAGDLRLYYRVPDPKLYVSATEILGDDYERAAPRVAGQIVLIGTSASGLLDLHTTALGDNVPGVSIHAEAIDQIVAGQYLVRADWLEGAEILVFVLAGLLLVVVVLRLGPRAGLLAGTILIAGMGAASWQMFSQGLLVDPIFPMGGALIVYGSMVYAQFSISDAARRQVRRAFGYYVAPQLLEQIERNADSLHLGGERRDISVMFADMRGFTAYTERHTPEETLKTLNTLFGALGAEIVDRFGTIDKFIGDSIMAFWSAPVDVPDHARRAAEAALAMRATLRRLNEAGAFGEVEIAIGVGVATGEALVGNMGLETRFDYSTIGDAVNVAARVETASKVIGFDLVAAETTWRGADGLAWLEAGTVALAGKTARVPIHILVGDEAMAASAEFQALSAAHAQFLKALRGGVGIDTALLSCVSLCTKLEPRLMRFYEMALGRAEDFASPA